MRRLIPLVVAVLAACVQILPEEGLAAFLGTRADAPLEQTVWHHATGQDYDKYVWFQDGEMRLFYGLQDQDGIQRWSEFFTAPYGLENGLIAVSLTYPNYGSRLETNTASVVRAASAYEIDIDGERYVFAGTDASTFAEDMWMTITVNIVPWEL